MKKNTAETHANANTIKSIDLMSTHKKELRLPYFVFELPVHTGRGNVLC